MASGDVGHFDDGRPPVRRRPRRRDDRLRRRERLPARGRGPAGRATRRRRGRGRRRRRRGVRPAAEGVRRRCASGGRARGRRSRRTSSRTSPATRCRARSCSWTSCRATRPARSLKRELRADERLSRRRGRYIGGMAARTDMFDLGRLRLTPAGGAGRPGARGAPGRVQLRRPALRAGARRGAGAARRHAHDRRRLQPAPALRGGADRAVHALPGAGRARWSRSTPARSTSPAAATSSRARTWRAGSSTSAAWAHDALALAPPRPAPVPRGLRGALPAVRRRPQRGRPRAPPRDRARPALGQAARAQVRVAAAPRRSARARPSQPRAAGDVGREGPDVPAQEHRAVGREQQARVEQHGQCPLLAAR